MNMYEKGNTVRVTVNIGNAGLTELEFIGRVVIDATDFMAIQFDTIVIPKMEIRSAELLPEAPLEDLLGTSISRTGAVNRPKPPFVDNVRFLSEEPEVAGSK